MKNFNQHGRYKFFTARMFWLYNINLINENYLEGMDALLVDDKSKLETARQVIINAIGDTMKLYGITPSNGRLFGVLFFNEKPMTLDEMAQTMGMSKTSMSMTARSLLDINMVERVWQKGIRKDLYTARSDFFKNFVEFFARGWRWEKEISMRAIEKALPIYKELLESPDEDVRRQAQKDLQKIEESLKYYRWLDKIADFFESGKIFEYVPKDE